MRTNWLLYVGIVFFVLVLHTNHVLAEESISSSRLDPVEVQVILERVYLDGEISEEQMEEKIWSMEQFWSKYDQWQVVNMDEKSVVFRKHVDDISPLLKANGYFGITDDGVLTIHYGKPQKYNIIQSFFQLDIGKLESRRHEELKEGIPIKNKDRYVEVLETFKNYTVQEKQAN